MVLMLQFRVTGESFRSITEIYLRNIYLFLHRINIDAFQFWLAKLMNIK